MAVYPRKKTQGVALGFGIERRWRSRTEVDGIDLFLPKKERIALLHRAVGHGTLGSPADRLQDVGVEKIDGTLLVGTAGAGGRHHHEVVLRDQEDVLAHEPHGGVDGLSPAVGVARWPVPPTSAGSSRASATLATRAC